MSMVCETSKVFGHAQESTKDLTLFSIEAKIVARVDRDYGWAEITKKPVRHLVGNHSLSPMILESLEPTLSKLIVVIAELRRS